MAFFSMLGILILMFLSFASSQTLSSDVSALSVVKLEWENTPSEWQSPDPCQWKGVYCTGKRITALYFSSLGLKGRFIAEIGQLTALKVIDFSYNPGLSGPLPSSLENLVELEQLILISCSFNGIIPPELGRLTKLVTLDLNSNKMSGPFPVALTNITSLYWFDIFNNSISGSLPVELKNLVNCGHFHFSKNQLTGKIPPDIFHSNMTQMKHVLFDDNRLSGEIPSTIGTIPQSLTALRLDRNSLEGPIPTNISQLIHLTELYLSNNNLNGIIPDLSTFQNLQIADLSNNSFSLSDIPKWFYSSPSIVSIVMESCNLNGSFPSEIFSSSTLETLILKNNSIGGAIFFANGIRPNIKKIDLRFNQIKDVPISSSETKILLLEGNPVCSTNKDSIPELCSTKLAEQMSYSTSLSQCANSFNCTDEILKMNPVTCQCAMPLEGTVVLRSPPFKDLEGPTRFQKLETSLIEGLNLKNGSGGVYLCCMALDKNEYINIKVEIFPAYGMKYFNSTTLEKILFAFSNQTYKTPDGFGPYFFNLGKLYIIPGSTSKDSKSLKMGTIIGIAVGAAVLVLVIFILVVWAFRLKKKTDKLGEVPDPFTSWGVASGRTDAPKLQGARCFSFKELKVATSNFSDENLIGIGGYGQVYKGFLPGGEMIAVKRAKSETLVQRGGSEFKTELELLSRVHHTNLVGLIGFCLEEREQMLVYEHMPNGSLRDNLYGKTGIRLDWKRRLRIALGTARGLVYLHEHADPPIIHRDVKSSNILLDMNMNAKVADFGLGKLLTIPGTNNAVTRGHVTTEVKGTMGYVDPEYYMTQQLTHKSDVYSFGVVMLEIMAARQPIERGTYLVREARSAVDSRDGINELKRYLLDPFLRDMCAPPISTLERFVRLALHCTEEVASCRPTMSDVVKELESILEAVKALDPSGMESPTADGSSSFFNSDPNLRNQHKSRFYPYASPTGSSNTTNSLDNSNAFGVSNFVEPK